MKWHVGCSGFHYTDWKDVFYPPDLPENKWFLFYNSKFHTLELNVSFYKFPTTDGMKKWYNKSPKHFTFAVKAPRIITHFHKLQNCDQYLLDFYTACREGLKEKLGCVLFQLPPQIVYSEEKLERILEQIDPGFNNVIEFRHASWWRPDVILKLEARQVSFCGVSFPKIPHDHAVINNGIAYYRFHGVPLLFHSAYEEPFLQRTVDQIACSDSVHTVFLYFNNTASSAALANAGYVQQLVAGFC